MATNVRAKTIAIYALLIGANALVWILALVAFTGPRRLLLGTAALAYAFGLRHAVDADHICAIDNVTRKLMQEGKRPVGVGFFFSLGHSTIVIALTLLIVIAAATVKQRLPQLEGLGGVVGTSISAGFLFAVAAINAFVLVDIVGALRRARRGYEFSDSSLNDSLDRRGLLGRFFRPLLRLVSKSLHMYPVGVLFGLGFDTATEVGLLGIAAIEAGKGLPIWAILIFPALFTAGMSLIDTTDGILMLGAYGWAFVNPVRKLSYNMTITSASVLVAVLVGSIEVASILGANVDLGWLGFAIVGLFVLSWLASVGFHRAVRYRKRGASASSSEDIPGGIAMPSADSQASMWLK
jgi:nickel/cobalt transporter (NiCoT) family protein